MFGVVDTCPRSDADVASAASANRKQHDPDWLQPFKGGRVEGESGSSSAGGKIPKNTSSTNSNETLQQSWTETLFIHSFSEGPRGALCKRTKITRAPRRRNPASREDKVPQASNFGDTTTADHTAIGPSICGSSTRFGYSMDTELSVQKQDCARYDDNLAAILTSRKQAWNTLVYAKSFRRSLLES